MLSELGELRPDIAEEGTGGLQSQCSHGAFAVGVAGHLGVGTAKAKSLQLTVVVSSETA